MEAREFRITIRWAKRIAHECHVRCVLNEYAPHVSVRERKREAFGQTRFAHYLRILNYLSLYGIGMGHNVTVEQFYDAELCFLWLTVNHSWSHGKNNGSASLSVRFIFVFMIQLAHIIQAKSILNRFDKYFFHLFMMKKKVIDPIFQKFYTDISWLEYNGNPHTLNNPMLAIYIFPDIVIYCLISNSIITVFVVFYLQLNCFIFYFKLSPNRWFDSRLAFLSAQGSNTIRSEVVSSQFRLINKIGIARGDNDYWNTVSLHAASTILMLLKLNYAFSPNCIRTQQRQPVAHFLCARSCIWLYCGDWPHTIPRTIASYLREITLHAQTQWFNAPMPSACTYSAFCVQFSSCFAACKSIHGKCELRVNAYMAMGTDWAWLTIDFHWE